MKHTEFFYRRYILNPRAMSWVEQVPKDERNQVMHYFRPSDYILGKSNWTAKPRGGVMVAAFLAKDENIILDRKGDPEANNIIWVVRRCSDKENFNTKEAKTKAFYKAHSHTAMISKNHSYPDVCDIADKLVDLVENFYKKSTNKNQVWEGLKSGFNIDAWIESGKQNVDSNVSVNPIVFATRQ